MALRLIADLRASKAASAQLSDVQTRPSLRRRPFDEHLVRGRSTAADERTTTVEPEGWHLSDATSICRVATDDGRFISAQWEEGASPRSKRSSCCSRSQAALPNKRHQAVANVLAVARISGQVLSQEPFFVEEPPNESGHERDEHEQPPPRVQRQWHTDQ